MGTDHGVPTLSRGAGSMQNAEETLRMSGVSWKKARREDREDWEAWVGGAAGSVGARGRVK